MKLKSLFLASLAAMAMVSCSNDNDPINADGGNGEKNAVMQFRIGFSNSTTTRADETNGANGGQEAGLDKEQKFANALLIAAYENGTNEVIVKTITREEFTPTNDPSSNGKYYQSTPFQVPSGKVKAYVILNPTGISTTGITGKQTKFQRFGVYSEDLPGQVDVELAEVKVDQRRNAFGPGPQRRKGQHGAAELFCKSGSGLGQALVLRTHAGENNAVAAAGIHIPEGGQKLNLPFFRQHVHALEKNGVPRIAERRVMVIQHKIPAFFIQQGATNDYKGVVAQRTGGVEHADHLFLSGAVLPCHQNGLKTLVKVVHGLLKLTGCPGDAVKALIELLLALPAGEETDAAPSAAGGFTDTDIEDCITLVPH